MGLQRALQDSCFEAGRDEDEAGKLWHVATFATRLEAKPGWFRWTTWGTCSLREPQAGYVPARASVFCVCVCKANDGCFPRTDSRCALNFTYIDGRTWLAFVRDSDGIRLPAI